MAAALVSRLRWVLLLALALLTRQGGGAFWPSRLPNGAHAIVQAVKVRLEQSVIQKARAPLSAYCLPDDKDSFHNFPGARTSHQPPSFCPL